MNLPDQILITLARKNFWAFCVHYDKEFFSNKRPFLYLIAIAFQKIADGIILRLSVSLPPRAGKSYIASLFCAWIIGREPTGSVMRNSVTATLYSKFSYDVRAILKDDRYKRVFPESILSDDKQAVTSWNTTEAVQVSYFGNGVGGTIIGFGATLVAITDDLYRGHEDAMSETINDKTQRWYESAHLSRIEKECPQIDIGTRWSKSDVIGRNIESGFYDEVIIVPAMIDEKSFCEDVKTTKEYEEIRSRTDPFIWSSEYMQEPIELEGTIFPHSELLKWDEIPEEGIDICFADTKIEGLDAYSCPFGRVVDDKVYIYDVVFNRYNIHQNEPIMLARLEVNKTDKAYIESNAAGAMHIENIKSKTITPIFRLLQTQNKMLRILAESGFILTHFYFPRKSPSAEYDRFYLELTSLLKTSKKKDDAADSLSGLSKMARRDFIRS